MSIRLGCNPSPYHTEVEYDDGFVKAVDMRHVSTDVLEQMVASLKVKQ